MLRNLKNHLKSINKATESYRQSKPKKIADSFKNSSKICDQKYPESVQNMQKRKYMKRKAAHNDSEHGEPKRLEKRSGCPTSPI